MEIVALVFLTFEVMVGGAILITFGYDIWHRHYWVAAAGLGGAVVALALVLGAMGTAGRVLACLACLVALRRIAFRHGRRANTGVLCAAAAVCLAALAGTIAIDLMALEPAGPLGGLTVLGLSALVVLGVPLVASRAARRLAVLGGLGR